MCENKKIGYKDIFTQKEYIKLIFANLINRFGDSVDGIAFTWMVYQLTNSATWSAIIFGVNKLPTIFLQPLAGSIIENIKKKYVMIISDIIRGVCVTFIMITFALGVLNPWILLIITFILSSAEAFRLPASVSVVPNVLKKETIEFGLSLNASASNIVELIGLGISGFIIAQFGIVTAIAIDSITFFASALIIGFMDTKEVIKEHIESSFSEYSKLFKEGIRYVSKNKFILNLIILAILANAMFVPINSLQAPLISEVLKSGPDTLSLMSVSFSLSMLIATISFPYISDKMSEKMIILLCGISFGLYYISLILIGVYIQNQILKLFLVCISSFIAGYLLAILSTSVNVLFMKNVHREYIARAAAIINAASVSAVPIVSFIISIGTAFLPIKYDFIICGILLIIIMPILGMVMDFNPKSEDDNTNIAGATSQGF